MGKIKAYCRNSFTLLEVIMVITIIGIMAVLAANRIAGTAESKINLAAEKIVSDIRYCQNLAMSMHKEVIIYFNTSANRYAVKDSAGSFFKDPFTHEDFVIDFSSGQLRGVSLDSVDFDSAKELHFDVLGRPKDSSGNFLSTQGRIDISYKGYSKTIVVYPNTGFCKKL